MSKPPKHALPEVQLSEAGRDLLAQIADKWTLLILIQLCQGPLRFNALKRSLGSITPKALAQVLRRLERNGLITRRIIPGSPPGVEYAGTELGFSLGPPIHALCTWSSQWLAAVQKAQEAFDRLEGDV